MSSGPEKSAVFLVVDIWLALWKSLKLHFYMQRQTVFTEKSLTKCPCSNFLYRIISVFIAVPLKDQKS